MGGQDRVKRLTGSLFSLGGIRKLRLLHPLFRALVTKPDFTSLSLRELSDEKYIFQLLFPSLCRIKSLNNSQTKNFGNEIK